MRTLNAALLFVAVGLAAITTAPHLAGAQSPPVTNLAGQEIRATIWTGNHAQDHIWRFRAGGAVSGLYTGLSNVGELAHAVEGSDTGTWSARGETVCIQWRAWFDRARTCYRIERTKGIWFEASPVGGGRPIKGTLTPYR